MLPFSKWISGAWMGLLVGGLGGVDLATAGRLDLAPLKPETEKVLNEFYKSSPKVSWDSLKDKKLKCKFYSGINDPSTRSLMGKSLFGDAEKKSYPAHFFSTKNQQALSATILTPEAKEKDVNIVLNDSASGLSGQGRHYGFEGTFFVRKSGSSVLILQAQDSPVHEMVDLEGGEVHKAVSHETKLSNPTTPKDKLHLIGLYRCQ